MMFITTTFITPTQAAAQDSTTVDSPNTVVVTDSIPLLDPVVGEVPAIPGREPVDSLAVIQAEWLDVVNNFDCDKAKALITNSYGLISNYPKGDSFTEQATYIIGGITGLIGLIVGLIGGYFKKKK